MTQSPQTTSMLCSFCNQPILPNAPVGQVESELLCECKAKVHRACKERIQQLQQKRKEQDLPALPCLGCQTICVICQEDFKPEEQKARLACWHLFHKDCFEHAASYTPKCPLCREKVETAIPVTNSRGDEMTREEILAVPDTVRASDAPAIRNQRRRALLRAAIRSRRGNVQTIDENTLRAQRLFLREILAFEQTVDEHLPAARNTHALCRCYYHPRTGVGNEMQFDVWSSNGSVPFSEIRFVERQQNNPYFIMVRFAGFTSERPIEYLADCIPNFDEHEQAVWGGGYYGTDSPQACKRLFTVLMRDCAFPSECLPAIRTFWNLIRD